MRAEKDAIALLGLLGRAYLEFDQPIPGPDGITPTHRAGLNIFGCVVDNRDGELLGIDRNTIHSDGSPLQHAEQRAVRTALARILAKRPRPPRTSVEQYYRTEMFMAKGTTPGDSLRLGATCYTTLEPCPMCAATLLQVRMKRVVFVLSDVEYGDAWAMLKQRYFPSDGTSCERMTIDGTQSDICERAAALLHRLRTRAEDLRRGGAKDMHALDACRDLLGEGVALLRASSRSVLRTVGADRDRNARTLDMLQQACAVTEPERCAT